MVFLSARAGDSSMGDFTTRAIAAFQTEFQTGPKNTLTAS
jgi:hypothetical protein